ncbi:FG-GAP repeat domain-containing protein, partial [Salinispora arenicola]|uniref:FG-GAP repeat domain-containing protein n=1 Tax=Salinispora arenicola TaxID=168697 RepID=UPI00051708AF
MGESQHSLRGATDPEFQIQASVIPPPDTPNFGPSIDSYAANDPQDTCDPSAKPGTVALRSLLNEAYGDHTGYIGRACDIGNTSEHKEGRALDYMLNVSNSEDRAVADSILTWMLATDRHGNKHAIARRLGIMYIIWNGHIWSAARADEGWRTYTGANPHTDHIHFSQSWAGATKQTSWWTATPQNNSVYMADYDGDGKSDLAFYRPTTGTWWLHDTNDDPIHGSGTQYGGQTGDTPAPGDYDGDGKSDLAFYRPTNGTWWLHDTNDNPIHGSGTQYGGQTGDIPVPGDYDGDGKS